MTRFLGSALAVVFCVQSAFAATTKYEKETEVSLGKNTKFKISAGWSFDDKASKLISPEGDVTIYLIETPFTKDPEAVSIAAWKAIDPKFNFKVLQKVSPPAKEGWEEAHQVVYEVPVKDNRTVMTAIHVYKGIAYMLLIDAANAGLGKRAAQLQIVGDTWRPLNLKKEDLSQNKIKSFSSDDAVDLDRFITKAMKDLSLPGVSVGIVQNGKVVYRKGFGVKQLGKKDAVTPETMFMIGSTTKPFTTLMLSKLVEEGKVTWDTPIEKALPGFGLADKDITAKFQVKHTACACTGMPRRDMEFVFGSLSNTVDDSLRQLHSMKPTTGFGETFQYSNLLVATGGLIGGNVYGKGNDLFTKYENVMNDLVFGPLGMTSTRVKPTAADIPNLASPHARGFDSVMAPFPQKIDDMVYAVAPAGSVWSNVDDLSKYLMMELKLGKSPEGKALFSEEQILKRRTPGVKVDENSTYGLGLFIENNKGIKIIGHGGNTLGFTHDLFFLPDHGVGMVVQTNAGSVNGLRNSLKQKLLELLLGAIPKSDESLKFSQNMYKQMGDKARERTSVKSADVKWVADYIGEYENKDLGKISITKDGSGYKLKTNRWESKIGSAKEQSGERLVSLVTVPWSGGFELRVQKDPMKKLILDDEQVKYEFTPIKK